MFPSNRGAGYDETEQIDTRYEDRREAEAERAEMYAHKAELRTLRANLENLAERWEAAAMEAGLRSSNHARTQSIKLGESATELRRTLSGETPPSAGEEWPAPEAY